MPNTATMKSRLLIGTALLAGVVVGMPPGSAAVTYYKGPLTANPLAGCRQLSDPTGDANPTLLTLPVAGAVQTGQDPALDLTAISTRTSPTTFDFFLTVDHLNHFAQTIVWTRMDFIASFTAGGKAVVVDGAQDYTTTATVAGADATSTLKPAAVFDFAHNQIVLSVNRAGLAAAVGALPDGTTLSALGARTSVTSLLNLISAPADSMGPTSYVVGDNTCFVPPPGRLTLSMPTSGQYTDDLDVTATLVDAAGHPDGGVLVTGVFGSGTPVSAVTDDVGVAHFTFPIRSFDQSSVSVSWAGDNEVGPAQATRAFTVLTERTRLTATAGRGTVKATLLDDDGEGVGGQRILFTIGSKDFYLTTGSSGETVFKCNPGTLVKVSYAGKAPFFTSAPSASARARA